MLLLPSLAILIAAKPPMLQLTRGEVLGRHCQPRAIWGTKIQPSLWYSNIRPRYPAGSRCHTLRLCLLA